MAKILIVHGIGNQYLGEMELHSEWYPALCDGLHRVGHAPPPPEPADCFCPFYGDVFRPVASLGGGDVVDFESLASASEDERQLLEAVWRAAAATDPDVPAPEEYGDTLLWAPRLAERAVNSLARSKYLADLVPLQFFGHLKQVVRYLNDAATRQEILDRVLRHIGPDTRIVIGHSLGSVLAYEAVCAKPAQVTTLLTLGSPLGIPSVVFDKLTPRPAGGVGAWPGNVKWTNLAAAGDIVAPEKKLAPLFGAPDRRIVDLLIDSGWDAHGSSRYLNSAHAGRAAEVVNDCETLSRRI